jgi:chemotaxis family two-component system response regulator Rcp1
MMNAAAERLILVVDDNQDHIQIIEQTLNESLADSRIVAVASGQAALNFLHRREQYTASPRPDIVLLDLDLPDLDGLQFLEDIKTHPHLHRIPIIVFTLTNRMDQIFRSYALQGNCYVLKSDDRQRLSEIIKRIREFWLGIVTLPIE